MKPNGRKPGIWIGDRQFATMAEAYDAWQMGDEVVVIGGDQSSKKVKAMGDRFSIGDRKFDSFDEAWQAATPGDVIFLGSAPWPVKLAAYTAPTPAKLESCLKNCEIFVGDGDEPLFFQNESGEILARLNGYSIKPLGMDAAPDISPLDRVKSAILELPKESQREIYKFLYTLGHRMF